MHILYILSYYIVAMFLQKRTLMETRC